MLPARTCGVIHDDPSRFARIQVEAEWAKLLLHMTRADQKQRERLILDLYIQRVGLSGEIEEG